MEAIDFLKSSECLDELNEFCDAKEGIGEGVRERAGDHYLLAEFVLFQEMKRLRANKIGAATVPPISEVATIPTLPLNTGAAYQIMKVSNYDKHKTIARKSENPNARIKWGSGA